MAADIISDSRLPPVARGRGINVFAAIALVTSIAIVGIAFAARVNSYHFAPLFLVPLVWAGYAFRRQLVLRPVHYALVCAAILLHMLGAFGYYQHSPFPGSFDVYVHFYFAFAAAFVVHRLILQKLNFQRWGSRLATVVVIMAMGAVHEVMEYSTLLLDDKTAMLKKDSYPWDTNRDLTNNLLGCILALVIISIAEARTRRPD